MTNETEGKRLPDKKFRAGAISATLWGNKGIKDGTEYEFTTIGLQRSYKDKEGNWKNSNSLRLNDLPKAVLVLNKAYEYLLLKEQANPQEVEMEEIF